MQEKQKVVSAIAAPIPEEVRKHIEATASAMIGHSNLTQADFQDICQEISLAVVKAAPCYKPSMGTYYTFAQTIIKRARCRIFRDRIYKKLDVPTMPLDMEVYSDEECELTLLDQYSYQAFEQKQKYEDLRTAVNDVVSSLPETPRQICILIMQGYCWNEILKILNITQSSYYRNLINIKNEFKKNQFFSKWVKKNSTFLARN